MSGSNSPAFTPPMNSIPDKDPMIMKVPMDRTDAGFRASQRPAMRNDMPLSHIPNGK